MSEQEYVGEIVYVGDVPVPSLDMNQPIVRCNDCAYFDTRKCKSQWPFRLDGFCAWGERRDA